MNHRAATFVLALLTLMTIIPNASAEDPRNRRLIVRNGELYRSITPVKLRAIETPGLFQAGVTEEAWVKAFINVSKVGATGIWFNLTGISPDGSSIDPAHVEALRTVKSECIYRYIAPVCRVLGAGPTDSGARLNAIRTVAKTFEDDYAMIYWIDGPDSDALVAEFKSLAPKLTVLAPRGGELELIQNARDAGESRTAVIVGELPPRNSAIHALMPEGEATSAAFQTQHDEWMNPDACIPTAVGLPEAEKADGFVSLFNGTSLDCWIITGRNPEGWTVRDGVIEWVAPGGGVVLSRKQYGDYVLRFEWKLFNEGANSGVFQRAPVQNRMSKMGFEFQTMGDYGVEPEEHATGSIYDVLKPLKNASRPVGEWNEVEIRLEGPNYKATLNGEVVQDVNFDDIPELKFRLRHGHLGIQDHDNKVMFRNIRIKEL